MKYIASATLSAETGYTIQSATHGDFRVRKMYAEFGNRAFSVVGPLAWNKLPI